MKQPKIGWGAGLLFVFLFLMMLMASGTGDDSSPAGNSEPQGIIALSTTTGASNQTTITINGATFQPGFSQLETIVDGSLWVLTDWWEDYENWGGTPTDWAFFIGDGSRVIVARCLDPTWRNPEMGTTYMGYANGELVPPTDPPDLQHFQALFGISNLVAQATPTASPTPIDTATATVTPNPTNQPESIMPAIESQNPQPTPTPQTGGGIGEAINNFFRVIMWIIIGIVALIFLWLFWSLGRTFFWW